MMKKGIDPLLLLIALLLGITLFLFFYGTFPYPFGFLILSVFFIARLMVVQGNNRNQ